MKLEFVSFDFLVPIAIVVIGYVLACAALGYKKHREFTLDPVKLTAGPFGRASLSNLQVLFFTLIVLWLALHLLFRNKGLLAEFDTSVLGLLGITALGTGGAKLTSSVGQRVSLENWAWLKAKGWIIKDLTRSGTGRKAQWADLLVTEQGFEVARFQAVVFSLVVGISLVLKGVNPGITDFLTVEIPNLYLGLLGLSQAVYVGGKAIGPRTIAELDVKLTKLRELELAFKTKVANAANWPPAPPAEASLDIVRKQKLADDEYVAYRSAADEAAEMVGERTGNPVVDAKREPALP